MTNKTFRQVLASAWIFLVSVALAACGSVVPVSSAAPANSASPGFTGYHWQVVAIGHSGKVTRIPARLGVALQFSPGGQFGAFDGVSFHFARYRATRDSFTTGIMAGTADGYAGDDPDILLARTAMASLDAATYSVRLTGDRLVVDIGSYTLTCHRVGPQADAPAPASTG